MYVGMYIFKKVEKINNNIKWLLKGRRITRTECWQQAKTTAATAGVSREVVAVAAAKQK